MAKSGRRRAPKGMGTTSDVQLAATSRRSPRSAPDLRERVRTQYPGLSTGPWNRWVEAKWLGAYTPSSVQHWVRKLMRRDPQIRLGLLALKAPFFGIDYRVEGGDPRARAFVKKTLLNDQPLWQKLIWSILNALDFGYQTHELLWDVASPEIHVESTPGASHTETFERAFVLRSLNDLDPERCFHFVDEFGDLEGCSVDSAQWIPAEKMLHAVHQFEHQNWHGTAIVDSSYIPWYHNNFFYLFLSRYLESKGNPPLKGRAPFETRFQSQLQVQGQPPMKATEFLAAEAMALQGGGICVVPSEYDEKGNNLWDLDVLADGGRTELFMPIIQHNESMKLRGVLVPERVATQDGSVGSYASSDVHLDVFFGIMEVIKNFLILGTINEHLVSKIVRYNFGKHCAAPTVQASELSRSNKALLGELLKSAMAIPRRLKNGQVYRIADTIDIIKSLEANNIPKLNPEDVAMSVGEFQALEAKPGAAPAGTPAPPNATSEDAERLAKALGMSSEQLFASIRLAHEAASSSGAPAAGKPARETLAAPLQSRRDMPQVKDLDALEDFLRGEGIPVKDDASRAGDLNGSQEEINQAKVDRLKEKGLKVLVGRRILVSRDGYVIDGHHWNEATRQLDPRAVVPVLRIDLPRDAAIDAVRRFPEAEFKGPRDGKVDRPAATDELVQRRDEAIALALETSRAVADRPIVVNVPQQAPPIVKVTVPRGPAPIVNVDATQAPPVVNVPAQAPPVVNVNVPPPAPPVRKKVTFETGSDGFPASATIRPAE
jgi:hypothetical protein